METYLAVYVGTPNAKAMAEWNRMEEGERPAREEAGMKAWGDWMAANESCIVHVGGPLGKTKRVSAQGISDVSNALSGFVILQAESHQAAAQKFKDHPHFTIFPGEAVEIMPCLPIPGA